jgi:hypothetical protein
MMSDIIGKYEKLFPIICRECKYYQGDFKCTAFDSIPEEILLGENNHSEVFPGQKEGFVFEPKEED